MNCVFCAQPEYAWNFYQKKRWPVRVGEHAVSIVCSNCLQHLLAGKKDSIPKAIEKALALNQTAQVEVLKHLLSENMAELPPQESVAERRVSLRHKGG